jgi:hypothetical protein
MPAAATSRGPRAARSGGALLALAAACAAPAAAAADAGALGISFYGVSYHFDRDRARALGVDNGFNPGLGVRYRLARRERWTFDVEAAAYYDSARNNAVVAGVAALWEVGRGFHAGGALALFDSPTYNHGRAFVAPIPVAAYEWDAVTLNATFLPKVGRYNDVATIAFWVTFWPKRW